MTKKSVFCNIFIFKNSQELLKIKPHFKIKVHLLGDKCTFAKSITGRLLRPLKDSVLLSRRHPHRDSEENWTKEGTVFRAVGRSKGTSKRWWVRQGLPTAGTHHHWKATGQVEEAVFPDPVRARPPERGTATEPTPERGKKYPDLLLLLYLQKPNPSRSPNELSAAVFKDQDLPFHQPRAQTRAERGRKLIVQFADAWPMEILKEKSLFIKSQESLNHSP